MTDKINNPNQDLHALLAEVIPEMECRVAALQQLWPGVEVLTHLHRNERILNELKKHHSKGSTMNSTTQSIVRTERGWAGHFCDASHCDFHRNTLLECGDTRLVVSTIGNYRPCPKEELKTIGYKRYYETMVFRAKKEGAYWDADVCDEYSIDSNWKICADSSEQLPDNAVRRNGDRSTLIWKIQ